MGEIGFGVNEVTGRMSWLRGGVVPDDSQCVQHRTGFRLYPRPLQSLYINADMRRLAAALS